MRKGKRWGGGERRVRDGQTDKQANSESMCTQRARGDRAGGGGFARDRPDQTRQTNRARTYVRMSVYVYVHDFRERATRL